MADKKERKGTGYKLKQETLRSKYRKGKIPQTYTLKRGEGLTKAAEYLYTPLYGSYNDPSARILAQRHAFELARNNRLSGGLRAGQVLRAGRVNPYARNYQRPYWAAGFGGQGAPQAQQRQAQTRAQAREGTSPILRGETQLQRQQRLLTREGQSAALRQPVGRVQARQQGSGWQGMPGERQVVPRRQAYTQPRGRGGASQQQIAANQGAPTAVQTVRQQQAEGGGDFAQRRAAADYQQAQQQTPTTRPQYRPGNVVSPVRYGIYPYITPDIVYQERDYVQRAFDAGENPDYIPNYVASALGLDPAQMIASGYVQGSTGSWWQSAFTPTQQTGGWGNWDFSGYGGGGYGGYGYGGGGYGGGGGGRSYASPIGYAPGGRMYFDATSLGPVSWRI